MWGLGIAQTPSAGLWARAPPCKGDALLQGLESLGEQSPGECRVVEPVAGVLKDRLVVPLRSRNLFRIGAARGGPIPLLARNP